jgi:hypothetical protein
MLEDKYNNFEAFRQHNAVKLAALISFSLFIGT